ncbi:MAG: thioredoxin [Cyanobacteria bacterium P01_F01_bin.150]
MTTQPIAITADTFAAEVLDSSIPVVVDFWAPWCAPCRVMNPVIADLAQEYSDVVKIGKVNVGDEEAIASQYNITSIPTLLVFRDGEIVERMPGLATKATILKRLQMLDIVPAIAA